MEREFQRKYLSFHYRQDAFLKLHNLQKQNLLVDDYTTEFNQLMLKCELVESKENTISCYLGELKSSINSVVQLQHYWMLLDAQMLVLEVEKQYKNIKTTHPFN